MKQSSVLIAIMLLNVILLSGCGDRMAEWSESVSEKVSEAGDSISDTIQKEGAKIAEKLDSTVQENESTDHGAQKDPTVADENSVEEKNVTESEELLETEEVLSGWNYDDYDALTNNNVRYAVRLLTDNTYEFSEYTYAEQFDKITSNPSEYYGDIISIAGTVVEIATVTEEFDANYKTSLYADGIRAILVIDVQGMSNASSRSMLIYSTQNPDYFLLDAQYSISGFIVGTSMHKVTIHLQGQTETNHVMLPAMVPDKELVYPMLYDEYIYGYLGSYEDEEFVEKMLNELYE